VDRAGGGGITNGDGAGGGGIANRDGAGGDVRFNKMVGFP